MNVKFLVWALIFSFQCASVATAADRHELVEGVFRSLPSLLHFVSDQPDVDDWSENEKAFLKEVIQIADSHSLEIKWIDKTQEFRDLLPKLPARLMKIRKKSPKTIDVNRQLVSDDSVRLDVPLLVKFFVHELSYLTSLGNLGFRDRVAQMVADVLAPYQQRGSDQPSGGRIEVFSLPSEKVLSDISGVAIDELQNTFLVFSVNALGDYKDLTMNVHSHLDKQKRFIRSQWHVEEASINYYFRELSEFMRALLDFWDSSSGQMNLAKPIFDELGLNVRFKFERSSKKQHGFSDVKMLTVLEIHESRWLSSDQFSLIATYSVKPTGRTHFLDFNQLSMLRPLTAPIVLRGGQNQFNFYSEVRPDTDYNMQATVSEDGLALSNEVNLNVWGLQDGSLAHLVLELSTGTFYLKPYRWQRIDNHNVLLSFRVPVGLIKTQKGIYAQSVQIDSNKTVWLNKTLSIRGQRRSGGELSQNTILEESLGAWGYSGGQLKLKKAKDFLQPEYVLDHVSGLLESESKVFFFDPIGLSIQFSLFSPARVKQVRFHFVRSIVAGFISKQRLADFKAMQFKDSNGRTVQISMKMDPAIREDFYEVVVAPINQIDQSRMSRDNVVVAKFNLPIRWSSQASEVDVVHYLPLLSPVLVEAVLEDGQVLRQNFMMESKSESSCNEVLSDRPSQLPIAKATARLRQLMGESVR